MKKLFLPSLILLFTGMTLAKPSTTIKEMMDRPLSAEDFLLFQLYDITKCRDWLAKENVSTWFCMNHYPQYNDEGNIELRFITSVAKQEYQEFLTDFDNASIQQKEQTLIFEFYRISTRLGLYRKRSRSKLSSDNIYFSGLIDRIQLPESYNDPIKIKHKIVLYLILDYGEAKQYRAKLDINGKTTIVKTEL